MSILAAVESAESLLWETVSDFTIPLAVLRRGTGEAGFDPVTMEPLPSSSFLYLCSGVLTNYSAHELLTLKVAREPEQISIDNRKVIVKLKDFTPAVGDVLVIWDFTRFIKHTSSLLLLPNNYPASSSKEVWICPSSGIIGEGPTIPSVSLLYAPGGSLGGLYADVGTDWVVYPPLHYARILNVRDYNNFMLTTKVLDITLSGS